MLVKVIDEKIKISLIFIVPFLFMLLFFDLSELVFWEYIGLLFSCFVLYIFIIRLGKSIPIEEFTTLLLLIQMVNAPIITYHYYKNDVLYEMFVSPEEYFIYSVPAIIAFYLGFHGLNLKWKNVIIRSDKDQFELLSRKGRFWIIVAFVSQVLDGLLPEQYSFIFHLLINCRFVGLIYLLYTDKKSDKIWIFIVAALFVIDIIRGAIFYDLFAMVGLIYMYYAHKRRNKPRTNLLYFGIAFVLIILIQSVKYSYREIIWYGERSQDSRIEVFFNLIIENVTEGAIFADENFERTTLRLNQGWILSRVLYQVPDYEEFSDGEELLSDLTSVLTPRFLYPNKKSSGGEENQLKFTKYTGRELIGNTTMRIGVLADAYINFSIIGGIICMFLFGVLLKYVIRNMIKNTRKFPLIIFWIPFLFNYVIRMSDFLVTFNYLFKGLIIFIVLLYVEKRFIKESVNN